ncbi:hypothetical protein GRI42_13805 [Erythrobacter gaetbuli]|uniref:DUF4268 domain-containing protein n=1 Tax=Qipengyuania gaetbuli TaxID=266952 RepID=A0A844Y309_9SPHN|nr:hypothetical protein [Qipengyuania gaetbuli]MXO52381.1 hypothetical protein [Qipengyuania gaetbuli]
MSRQHTKPILVSADGETSSPLVQLTYGPSPESVSEAWIQELVHRHPSCLPIEEVDSVFANPVSICCELNTPAGPIDNFLVTPSGLPVLVECKLWRNPEGRREVVGQILDYAKELALWTSSDLQREVARRVGGEGNPILRLLREAGHEIDEVAFNDALTANLRRGRFLLLIVGDGIREGTEAIAGYLQSHLGLHFSMGLVEMPIFTLPDQSRLVAPRILARTSIISRNVVSLPDGFALQEESAEETSEDRQVSELSNERQQFWSEFLTGLRLDDPEQPIPKPSKQGYLAFMLPAPSGSSWITVWREVATGEVGLTLGWSRGYLGEDAGQALVGEWETLQPQLGGDATLAEIRDRLTITERYKAGDLADPSVRGRAFAWLRERVNEWINVLRPEVRSLVAELVGDPN